jgi:type III secretion protein D
MRDVARTDTPDQGWRLHVRRGPNLGATVPLQAGAHRLGRRFDNDIVLADSALADAQAVIAVGREEAVIEPLAPGLRLSGHNIRPGRERALRAGSRIEIGDTLLEITGPAPRARRRWLALPIGAVVLAGAVSVALATSAPPAPPHRAFPVVTAAATPAAAPSAASAGAALGAQLQDAGIGGAVHLASQGGAVIAEGAIDPAQMPRWTDAQMWFDAHYKGAITLIDHVHPATAASDPHPRFRAVSLGAMPYAVGESGDRYTVGAVLDGGWTISAITPEHILLTRDGRTVAVTL